MKTRLHKNLGTGAGALVVTLVICSILSLSIFGYLSLVEQQSKLSARSQAWNAAIAVAEAGIEEGLQHLNANYTNLASQGWSANGAVYSLTNSMADGSSYYVTIDYTTIYPVVTCQSFLSPQSLASLATVGVTSASTLSRKVRVRCYRGSLFLRPLAADEGINMNGNNVMTDSFDSADPLFSTGGRYDPRKRKSNGDVASNMSITNSINLGNANIFGRVATGPGGSVTIGDQGAVGAAEWQLFNNGFQPGWVTDDSNFTFPDTTIPYKHGMTPSSGWVTEAVLVVTTNSTVSSDAPEPGSTGVGTNIASMVDLGTSYPNPPPLGLATNTTWRTTNTKPDPMPVGTRIIIETVTTSEYPTGDISGSVKTNLIVASSMTWTKYAPTPGTYVPPYETKAVATGTPEDRGVWYGYYRIEGRTYTYDKITYKVPTYYYSYPIYQYVYYNYATNTVYQTNYYDNILSSGKYYINGALSGKTLVTGQAELVSAGGINMSGNDVLKIKPGGSLSNYVGGTTASIQGNGIINETGNAAKCVTLCEKTVTTLVLGGNGEFIGILIAPRAVTQLNGGGTSWNDFTGVLMMRSLKMNGHYKFHYDEALARLAGSGRYLISSWEEMSLEYF